MNNELLKRRLDREIQARKEAEQLLDDKSKELYDANQQLLHVNKWLEDEISKRTAELEHTVAKLKYSNAELEDFAYIVSHDLKAPLRAIGSLSDWLLEDNYNQLNDGGKEKLDLLKQRVLRMNRLILAVLDYSRAGKESEKEEWVDPFEETKEILHSLEDDKKVIIEGDFENIKIYCAKVKLGQVLQNILTNAIKHCDKDQVKIALNIEEDKKFTNLSLRDNGPGINPQFHDKVFKMFQTLQARDKFESTGVGLNIVKKILLNLEGEVELKSQEGEGATFILKFPHKIIKHEE